MVGNCHCLEGDTFGMFKERIRSHYHSPPINQKRSIFWGLDIKKHEKVVLPGLGKVNITCVGYTPLNYSVQWQDYHMPRYLKFAKSFQNLKDCLLSFKILKNIDKYIVYFKINLEILVIDLLGMRGCRCSLFKKLKELVWSKYVLWYNEQWRKIFKRTNIKSNFFKVYKYVYDYLTQEHVIGNMGEILGGFQLSSN